jgi:hypothetical protein
MTNHFSLPQQHLLIPYTKSKYKLLTITTRPDSCRIALYTTHGLVVPWTNDLGLIFTRAEWFIT